MKQTSLVHTIVLFCILGGGLLTFWYAKGHIALQLTIGTSMAVSYVVWGILHHRLKGDLHRNVVIEYVLVGLIAVVLLTTLAL